MGAPVKARVLAVLLIGRQRTALSDEADSQ